MSADLCLGLEKHVFQTWEATPTTMIARGRAIADCCQLPRGSIARDTSQKHARVVVPIYNMVADDCMKRDTFDTSGDTFGYFGAISGSCFPQILGSFWVTFRGRVKGTRRQP